MMEQIIDGIVAAMQEDLTDEQLRKLESVLIMQLHGLKIEEEGTPLLISESHWMKVLRLYIASKRIENCAESTLENYERCIRMMMESLNKKITDITTNDLRYYLADYQDRRKISLS